MIKPIKLSRPWANQKGQINRDFKIVIIDIRKIPFLYFITPILKSLVVPVIWLALIGAIYWRIAPFFCFKSHNFSSQWWGYTENKTTNQIPRLVIAGKWRTKSIMWQILQPLFRKLSFFPPKMDEFNFKLAQYCINKIFELTESCTGAISKWM